MKRKLAAIVVALLCVSVVAGYFVTSTDGASSTDKTVLVYDGPSIANTQAPPNTPAFTSWCSLDGPCSPSVTMPAIDASTGELRGQIYVRRVLLIGASAAV